MTKGQSRTKYCLICIKIHDKRAIKNKILFNMYLFMTKGQSRTKYCLICIQFMTKGQSRTKYCLICIQDKRAIKNKILFNMTQKGNQEQNTV